MAPSTVVAVEADRDRCTAALVAAFVNDPLIRWMFPDPGQYLEWFPEVLRHFGGGAFDHGSARRTHDFAGVALWLPPGTGPDEEALGRVMEEAVEGEHLGEIFGFMEQVGASHPTVDHWYLPAIGVDPFRQGSGYGSTLLTHTLAQIDEQGVATYLESSSPLNIPLYRRFGFDVLTEIQAGSSPPIWPMLRPARAA